MLRFRLADEDPRIGIVQRAYDSEGPGRIEACGGVTENREPRRSQNESVGERATSRATSEPAFEAVLRGRAPLRVRHELELEFPGLAVVPTKRFRRRVEHELATDWTALPGVKTSRGGELPNDFGKDLKFRACRETRRSVTIARRGEPVFDGVRVPAELSRLLPRRHERELALGHPSRIGLDEENCCARLTELGGKHEITERRRNRAFAKRRLALETRSGENPLPRDGSGAVDQSQKRVSCLRRLVRELPGYVLEVIVVVLLGSPGWVRPWSECKIGIEHDGFGLRRRPEQTALLGGA
jgi:hypothetical protein